MLKERLRQDAAGSSGALMLTKALTFDLDYSGLIKQLSAISLCPDPDELRELKGRLASMENMFKFRTKDLQKKWEQAENAVRKSLGLEQMSKPRAERVRVTDASALGHEIAITNKPYDDEAGF